MKIQYHKVDCRSKNKNLGLQKISVRDKLLRPFSTYSSFENISIISYYISVLKGTGFK